MNQFGDFAAFNFRQLSNGKWAGESFSGVFVTVDTFKQGEHPDDRWKYTSCQKASEIEVREYWGEEDSKKTCVMCEQEFTPDFDGMSFVEGTGHFCPSCL